MKYSVSQKLVQRPSPILSFAANRQLCYFEPKGASKRILPNLRPINKLVSLVHNKSTEILSPLKLPIVKNTVRDHSVLIKSTRTIKKLILISSRDGSPTKLVSNCSQDSLDHISEIMDSCDKIAKINKSDILLASQLIKKSKFAKKSETEKKTESIKGLPRRSPTKGSIDKIMKESFETTYYIEKTLNRKNSVKKLKEKIMPWKKITIINK